TPPAEQATEVRPASAAPTGASPATTDPGATVEWSTSDVAALGLEGAPRGRDEAPAAASGPAWDDWDEDAPIGESTGSERLQPLERDRVGAPRWQIALVAVLLVAVIVVLILTLMGGGGDDATSTTPSTQESTTTRKRTTTRERTGTERGAAPSRQIVASVRLQNATVLVRSW
ncbi:hypothetical protein ACVU7I_11135, partial [Patulibacter sp. S7RM1-6]